MVTALVVVSFELYLIFSEYFVFMLKQRMHPLFVFSRDVNVYGFSSS